MTEQPAEPITEQEFLGNEPKRQSYLPNGHRLPGTFSLGKGRYLRPDLSPLVRSDVEQARAEQLAGAPWAWSEDAAAADVHALPAADDLPAEPSRQEPDLWLETETHATRALNEIQDGNINSSIAFLQSALAFALNYRHSISYEVTGQ